MQMLKHPPTAFRCLTSIVAVVAVAVVADGPVDNTNPKYLFLFCCFVTPSALCARNPLISPFRCVTASPSSYHQHYHSSTSLSSHPPLFNTIMTTPSLAVQRKKRKEPRTKKNQKRSYLVTSFHPIMKSFMQVCNANATQRKKKNKKQQK